MRDRARREPVSIAAGGSALLRRATAAAGLRVIHDAPSAMQGAGLYSTSAQFAVRRCTAWPKAARSTLLSLSAHSLSRCSRAPLSPSIRSACTPGCKCPNTSSTLSSGNRYCPQSGNFDSRSIAWKRGFWRKGSGSVFKGSGMVSWRIFRTACGSSGSGRGHGPVILGRQGQRDPGMGPEFPKEGVPGQITPRSCAIYPQEFDRLVDYKPMSFLLRCAVPCRWHTSGGA